MTALALLCKKELGGFVSVRSLAVVLGHSHISDVIAMPCQRTANVK